MSCFRLMNENFLDLDLLADSDYSSQQSLFPITNVYNRKRRTKVWRTNGYWNVEAGSNTIVFRETVGVDLTASIAVAEYVTIATFMAAIKAALEVAGDSTYTVTQNSNLKIVVSSNGSGGGGILQLMWTDADSLTMAGYMGYSTAANDTGALTYTADFLRIHAGGYNSEFAFWDMGISSNPRSFILIGARNSPIKISSTATITLQGNHTDSWGSPVYSEVVPYDTEAMVLLGDGGLHTEPLRFWRLVLDDQNVLGYIEIGDLYLGDNLVFDRGAVDFPLSVKLLDRSENISSEGGQTYSDIKEKTASYSFKWNALVKEDMEQITDFFDQVGTSLPFFISMDSSSVFSSSASRYVKYVKFLSEPTYELISPDYFQCNMDIREEL